jgi:3-(3-hydroxy-phenyl)propionate hydroxylase
MPEFAAYPFTAATHAARVPATDVQGVESTRHGVVIVGGGPTGLVAAIGLAVQGVHSVVIEADAGVCAGSRAICISRRSLEIAQRLGALQGFLDVGLPWTGGRSFYRDQQVLQFSMPTDANQKLAPMVNLAQYHIEQILLERALSFEGLIDIRWQTRVAAVDARADGVRLALESPAGRYTLDTDWCVAADGGRSIVRESLGLALEGTSYEGRYVIVDILLDSARPTERLAYFDPPCNPGSTVLVHKQPHGVWRIDYQLRDGEDPALAIEPDNVLPRVESLLAMMGETAPWRPIWISLYKANALTLARYRHGRVLFAGDAAHLMPIFGVRGANSSIDDADNLAWKLAAVVKGQASDTLLDSYSHERVAAARENLSHAAKSTEFMAPPSPAFELMRTAVLSLAAHHADVRSLVNPRQTSAIAYADSPLNGPSVGDFDAGPPPGSVLPECPIDGGFLTERASVGFTALHFGPASDAPRPTHAACAVQCVPRSVDITGRLYPLYGAVDGTLYVVRPDGHVLARWKDARGLDPAVIDGVMAKALGTPSTCP